jgi:DNA invertase Pin-like site-specific DNA recombinase
MMQANLRRKRKGHRTSTKQKVANSIGISVDSLRDEIKRLINEDGKSQTEVAEHFKIHRSLLKYWIQGYGIEIVPIAVTETDEISIFNRGTGPSQHQIVP